ncbi:MAG: hypothetical protein IPK60_03010 [Sandaracinaceae bacterium]|nr:hypothetical protein [Sandaracinaceae bacterium]
MPTHSRLSRLAPVLFIAATLATAGFGAALAQDSAGNGEQPATGAPENTPSAGGADGADAAQGGENQDGEVAVERRANLTGPEQISEGEAILERGNSLSSRVAQMLDEARRDHDILRITCLNDKLTQVNANMRSTDERVGALREASSTNDDGRRNHEYTVITVLGQKFRTLEQEANQCVGQEIFDTGVTRVETSVDPNAPAEEDPARVTPPPPIGIPFVPRPLSGTL